MNLSNIFAGHSMVCILIAFVAFLLTEVIKLPIKKATSGMDEDKRKRVNAVVMLIPLALCTIASVLYFGITKHDYFSYAVFDNALSAYMLSLSMYALLSRLYLVFKGFIAGKVTNAELTSDVVKYFKENIKSLMKANKADEKELAQVEEKLSSLGKLKDVLMADTISLDAEKLASCNTEIEQLKSKKSQLCEALTDREQKAELYKQKLYK